MLEKIIFPQKNQRRMIEILLANKRTEERMTKIHKELAELNTEANNLMNQIQSVEL